MISPTIAPATIPPIIAPTPGTGTRSTITTGRCYGTTTYSTITTYGVGCIITWGYGYIIIYGWAIGCGIGGYIYYIGICWGIIPGIIPGSMPGIGAGAYGIIYYGHIGAY